MRQETILVVDDEKLIRWSIMKKLQKTGFSVLGGETKSQGLDMILTRRPDLVLLDQRMPDGTGIELLQEIRKNGNSTPVIMLTALDKSDLAVQALKLGAADYLTKPVNFEELLVVVERTLETTRLTRQVARLMWEHEHQLGGEKLIGKSSAFRSVMEEVSRIAQSSWTTVLLTGESGTGKEVVARAIHKMSDRESRPFMAVNCSALTESLAESEMFGHEKGAFTDARAQRLGLFELADKGTVFLDEVGDSSPAIQSKLLRVIEEKTIRRLGGELDIGVDVRVMAATNQSLEQRMKQGSFRKDLYYRLNVARVHLPPVRERGEDVLLLAAFFLEEFNLKFHKKFKGLSEETSKLFLEYDWPGNVREIRNVIERAALLADNEYILPEQVRSVQGHHLQDGEPEPVNPKVAELSLNEIEKNALIRALEKAGHNQSEAARILMITRDTLRYRMKKHGISGPAEKG